MRCSLAQSVVGIIIKSYFTISLFFQRKVLLRHFLHFDAVAAFLAPHSRQILK